MSIKKEETKSDIVNALRIKIKTLSSSFRQIRYQYAYLPTYPIPPISTIYGFLSSALGKIVPRSNSPWISLQSLPNVPVSKDIEFCKLVYSREYSGMIIHNEILWNLELYLYLLEPNDIGITLEQLKCALKRPQYNLYLGRTEDLATVSQIDEIQLKKYRKEQNNVPICFNQYVPLTRDIIFPGVFYNIPLYIKQGKKSRIPSNQPVIFSEKFDYDIRLENPCYIDMERSKNELFNREMGFVFFN